MDINRFNFWHTLPVVLETISLSDYVAFDLEMTGVAGRSTNTTPDRTEAAAYRRAVEAATTFQILQIGLTCLSYDHKQKGMYLLLHKFFWRKWLTSIGYRARTFTFHLTPEFVPPNTALAKIIDRKLVLSYRSFLFLKENNFSFEKAFSQGVPYLSRAEGELAKTLYLSKRRRQDPGCADVWFKKFYNDTASQISTWLRTNPGSVRAESYGARTDMLTDLTG